LAVVPGRGELPTCRMEALLGVLVLLLLLCVDRERGGVPACSAESGGVDWLWCRRLVAVGEGGMCCAEQACTTGLRRKTLFEVVW
jgi:hypothetical protein